MWYGRLADQIGMANSLKDNPNGIYRCPADDNSWYQTATQGSGAYDYKYYLSYGINYHVTYIETTAGNGPPTKMPQFKSPSDVYFISETWKSVGYTQFAAWRTNFYAPGNSTLQLRHDNSLNMIYLDGHGISMRNGDFKHTYYDQSNCPATPWGRSY